MASAISASASSRVLRRQPREHTVAALDVAIQTRSSGSRSAPRRSRTPRRGPGAGPSSGRTRGEDHLGAQLSLRRRARTASRLQVGDGADLVVRTSPRSPCRARALAPRRPPPRRRAWKPPSNVHHADGGSEAASLGARARMRRRIDLQTRPTGRLGVAQPQLERRDPGAGAADQPCPTGSPRGHRRSAPPAARRWR